MTVDHLKAVIKQLGTPVATAKKGGKPNKEDLMKALTDSGTFAGFDGDWLTWMDARLPHARRRGHRLCGQCTDGPSVEVHANLLERLDSPVGQEAIKKSKSGSAHVRYAHWIRNTCRPIDLSTLIVDCAMQYDTTRATTKGMDNIDRILRSAEDGEGNKILPPPPPGSQYPNYGLFIEVLTAEVLQRIMYDAYVTPREVSIQTPTLLQTNNYTITPDICVPTDKGQYRMPVYARRVTGDTQLTPLLDLDPIKA